MQLSIIIVNYNVKYFLEQCLHSVIKACDGLITEIFVVDNNSTDGSREYLEPLFSNSVKFIWNQENAGFGKGNNQALAIARGEYILFLNPDTIITENSFTNCINYFEKNKNAAALGVHMIDGSGYFLRESKRSFPSPLASLTKVIGLASLFPNSIFAGYYATHISENENGKVDVLAGAFMMLKKNVLDSTAGFDEAFFMYGEDIDLSYRIQQAGFENHYFAGTSIIHFKGESTQQNKNTYTRDFYNAMKRFIHKHYRQQKLLNFFMNAAISTTKFIAGLKRKPKAKTLSQHPQRCALIASQGEFDKTLRIIKYAEPALLVCGRIKPALEDKGVSLGDITAFKEITEDNKINTIIFCEKNISYLQMIELMKKNPGYNYLFHANGSSSITGSRDRDSTGDVITVPSL